MNPLVDYMNYATITALSYMASNPSYSHYLSPELVAYGLDVVSGSILTNLYNGNLFPHVEIPQEAPVEELGPMFNIDAPVWEPPALETVVSQHINQAVKGSEASDVVLTHKEINSYISFDDLDLDATHLLAIREVFGGKLKMRLNNPLFKWMRDIKTNRGLIGQEATTFCIINHEILSHFASEFWSQDPRLHRLTSSDVSDEIEMATRIRVLVWLYFKKDLLSSTEDTAFPDMATYVDNLVKSKVISREEAEFIYRPIVSKDVMKTLLSHKPFPGKLEIPFSKMRFRVEDSTKGFPISMFFPVFVGEESTLEAKLP